MRRFALCVLLAAAGGCVTDSPERSRLNLYDRIDFLRATYNAALNARDYPEQSRIETSIAREAQRNFEMFLRDAADETEVRRRWLATFALAFSKRAEAGSALRVRLDDPDPLVRMQAAVGLGQLGIPNPPIDRVKQMLDEPDEYTRLGALFALKLMLAPGQDAGLIPRLVGLLDDPSEAIRSEVVLLMGRIRKMEFVEPLVKRAFRDASMLVRLNAAIMVGNYGVAVEHVVPHLIEMLKDLEAPVVQAAHWALKQVTGKDFDRGYHVWRDWYEEELKRYEYYCVAHADVVSALAGFCRKCSARLDRRLKPPPVPPRQDGKDEKK